jgi:hypothetical protein
VSSPREAPRLFYLAHPVRGYRFWRAFEFLRALNAVARKYDAAVVCPWLPQVISASSDSDPAAREFWLRVDKAHVRAYQGVIVVGYEVTAGMQEEIEEGRVFKKPVLNYQGFEPADAAAYLERYLETEAA